MTEAPSPSGLHLALAGDLILPETRHTLSLRLTPPLPQHPAAQSRQRPDQQHPLHFFHGCERAYSAPACGPASREPGERAAPHFLTFATDATTTTFDVCCPLVLRTRALERTAQ
eukprot:scaffold2901_cov99-Isochrysis_galbana.AAC.6